MDDNIRKFGVINGEKTAPATEELPSNTYFIEDIDDVERLADGFLIFTGHHVAIMKDTDKGAIPVLVVPLARVRAAGLVEDEVFDD